MLAPDTRYLLAHADLNALIAALGRDGRTVIGPRLDNGAIGLGPISSSGDLPTGYAESQGPARYRLTGTGNDRVFDHTVGPMSWKRWLYPPNQKLWSARRTADGIDFADGDATDAPAYALFGVRACDLSALSTLDQALNNAAGRDPGWVGRRSRAIVVAANCVRSADTCFCAAMSTGPKAQAGCDLALTELPGKTDPGFLVEIGTERGQAVLEGVPLEPATHGEVEAALKAIDAAARAQTRTMPRHIERLIKGNQEHPVWDDVAARCLGCANCTMVCPTCFCSTVEDVTSVDGRETERWRRMDSCFSLEFSYVHGGPVRRDDWARYRQWMSHKLAWWHDQFARSGCVGCGRCITWCPVGIDITREAAALAADDRSEEAGSR